MTSSFLHFMQLGFMAIFGLTQLKELWGSTEGTSTTWVGLWVGFIVTNLALSVDVYRLGRTRENWRFVITYSAWLCVGLSWLMAMLIKGTLGWNRYETLNTILAAVGIVATFVAARYKGWHKGAYGFKSVLKDAWVRACLAILAKSVPQASMALQVWKGIRLNMSPWMVGIGHLTIAIRITQTLIALRKEQEKEKRRNLQAILVSEIVNEFSWILFTIVWFKF